MNIIGTYKEKPGAYYIGKDHEEWSINMMRNNEKSSPGSFLIKNLYAEHLEDEEIVEFNSVNPESHIAKSDFYLSVVTRKKKGARKARLEGVSAKCGTTNMDGQIFRGSLNTVSNMGLIPAKGTDLYKLHELWLSGDKPLEIMNVDEIRTLKIWYKENWEKILENVLFGEKTKSSCLLLSNLFYDYKKNELRVDKTVLVSKKQVLEDLITIASSNNITEELSGNGVFVSGIINIQRAGGSSGGVGAQDWQARISRSNYIKWIEKERPQTVFNFHID